ncbi:E3 ubiquitin-protein ligase SH3RF2 isoform X2 [Hyla sarda]|uniref:E3 ubiquitin-protein ligase SH3RF2 isoform X2 n=1 Tax=Hyla sarda TaxID=327740 RepID=UPI0024C33C69|nr:E3 ubiquitin-protein ligase SH3RF2 isoform X2 [Hyla sarda]
MDELVVLDLLNCPVCLGKLNATAKVLPCQHTFCQPCLQRILKARKELRCPECRTPVYCSIEELPANLLLVRLLEGIKSGQGLVRKNSFQRVGGLFTQDSFRKGREQKTNHESSYRLFPKTRMPTEGVPCAKAVSSYRGQTPCDLSFSKGDIIILHQQLDDHWYQGVVNGESGVFPARSVNILRKIDKPPALCKALYNFELKDNGRGENKNCLKFVKDDIINVIRRVDDNWAEGKLGDQVGIFPLLFVELNSTAKQLLELNKAKRKDVKNLPFSSPLRKSPSNVKSSEPETMRRLPDGRRKTPRQFVLTSALNALNRIVHSPSGRQTPEISNPILISSSNTALIEKARYLPSSQNQVNDSFYYATLGPQGTGPSLVAFPSSHQSILANMCVAFYPYTAHGPDEIDLQKGEGVRVLGKFQEGWLRGVSLVTGKIGIFPSHCVKPVYRNSAKYPDPRLPSHQSNWISSNASVSSQGSVSETGITRPVRSFFVPTAVVEPVKKNSPNPSALVPTLHRRHGSFKKSIPPQKIVQTNTTSPAVSTLSRPSSGIVQPQQLFINATYSNVGASPDIRVRPSSLCDVLPLYSRPVDYRRYSAASSIAFEAREFPVKIDSPSKPPASAPPSILVKPDTNKSSSDKVKTVRFMNFSPPTLKRQNSHFDDKVEQLSNQPAKPENSSTPDTMLTIPLRSNPSSAQPAEGRKIQKLKNACNDLTPQSTLSFPNKKPLSDNSNRWSAIHQTQDVLSS